MKITQSTIKDAIKELKSTTTKQIGEFRAYMHPRAYFECMNLELCLQADGLNEKTGRSIWDRRTKGWKLIKSRYEEFLALPEL